MNIAIAQTPIGGDPRVNGANVRRCMCAAAKAGARLVQFPEGMLSGYAKHPIQDWTEVDWSVVEDELDRVCTLARELNIWVVLGCAHALTPPNWPHNSLYVVSDAGRVVNRYDKRICSHTETTRFYTPGHLPVVFEAAGLRFGCAICIEVNFPELFAQYAELGVDCLLLCAYPVDGIFHTKAIALAATYNYWLALAVPQQCAGLMPSSFIGPDGAVIARATNDEDLVVGVLERDARRYDVVLNKARPWRAGVRRAQQFQTQQVDDPRSTDRTC